jgi:uncharacterized lipoprotein YmbA
MRILPAGVIATAVLCLPGCASAPERLYSLDVPATTHAPATTPQTLVAIRSVSVPALVDRPQLVIRTGHAIRTLEQDRWAAPLKEQIPTLLAAALNDRAAGRRYVSGRAGLAAAATLAVQLSSLELREGEGVRASATWTLEMPGATSREGSARSEQPVAGTSPERYVEALERALTDIANQIGAALETP